MELFLQMAAEAGLDTSDTARMADLHGRVNLMRSGNNRLYEIDVSDAESPSAFVPASE
jgi:hypothetical protein